MKGHTRVNNIYLQSTSVMIDFLNSRWNSEPSNLNFGQRPTKGGKWVWKPIRFCWKRQGFKWHFCFTKNRWNHKVRMDTTWNWQKIFWKCEGGLKCVNGWRCQSSCVSTRFTGAATRWECGADSRRRPATLLAWPPALWGHTSCQ